MLTGIKFWENARMLMYLLFDIIHLHTHKSKVEQEFVCEIVCVSVISGDESPESLRHLQAGEEKMVKTPLKSKAKLSDPVQKQDRRDSDLLLTRKEDAKKTSVTCVVDILVLL